MAAPHDKRLYDKTVVTHLLVCEGLSNDDFGVARGFLFQEIWPGAGIKPGDFVNE